MSKDNKMRENADKKAAEALEQFTQMGKTITKDGVPSTTNSILYFSKIHELLKGLYVQGWIDAEKETYRHTKFN